MRGPFTFAELSELAGVPAEEMHSYVDAGLLSPDPDGLFDEIDALRLRLLLHYRDLGHSPADIAAGVPQQSIPLVHEELLAQAGAGHLTTDQVAERTGLSAEQVASLRTASGTPGGLMTEADVEVMGSVVKVLEAGVPWDAVLEAARVYGDAMRRLANTEVRILSTYMDTLEAAAPDPRERSRRLQVAAEMLQPVLDPLVVHLHRQHLLRAMAEDNITRLEAQAGIVDRRATILFVDLASFTPLAQVHGDEVAAEVLERFDTMVRALLVSHDGSIVKQIGDAFMITFRTRTSALRFAIELDEAVGREWNFPAIRVGIHCGEVLYRVGDYVGNTVNIAARVAALAEASEILITKPVAEAALEADIRLEPAGERDLRGLSEPLALYRVVRTGGRATRRERDPVCGMLVGAKSAARLLHGGYEFVFCSEDCLRRFLANPTRYALEPEGSKPIL